MLRLFDDVVSFLCSMTVLHGREKGRPCQRRGRNRLREVAKELNMVENRSSVKMVKSRTAQKMNFSTGNERVKYSLHNLVFLGSEDVALSRCEEGRNGRKQRERKKRRHFRYWRTKWVEWVLYPRLPYQTRLRIRSFRSQNLYGITFWRTPFDLSHGG